MDAVLEDGQRKNADYGFAIGDIRAAIQKRAPSLEAITTPQMVHWDAWDLNFFLPYPAEASISDILSQTTNAPWPRVCVDSSMDCSYNLSCH